MTDSKNDIPGMVSFEEDIELRSMVADILKNLDGLMGHEKTSILRIADIRRRFTKAEAKQVRILWRPLFITKSEDHSDSRIDITKEAHQQFPDFDPKVDDGIPF